VTRQVSCCANKKEVHQSEKPNITLPLLHNVNGDGQISQSVTTFTSCKSVKRQISHCCAKAKEVQHRDRGKPNITLPLLHDVKGDSQSQSVTTFLSCKV
jgi:hypothetical protein